MASRTNCYLQAILGNGPIYIFHELRPIWERRLDRADETVARQWWSASAYHSSVHKESSGHSTTQQHRHFRTWLDLEHSVVYAKRIHWNALVGYVHDNNNDDNNQDEKLYKYVYHVLDGREQLFCLTDDVHETYDLAPVPEWKEMLLLWRNRLIRQFESEQRGDDWVRNGQLVAGRAPVVFGPHYPCPPAQGGGGNSRLEQKHQTAAQSATTA